MSCKLFELTTRSFDSALRTPCSDSYKLKMGLLATSMSYYQRRNGGFCHIYEGLGHSMMAIKTHNCDV